MNLQPIYDIAELCSQKGITNAILSPGSRCAPITVGFARHPKMKCRSIPDERSAAFIGLGLAQKSKQATALVCTSGSAAYNYAPAVAEAFFQNIPLLIITADRPPEWIDQLDGQTIRQQSIYGKHVKHSFDLPVDMSHKDAEWHAYRTINEAINMAQAQPQGPVHLNIPIREPFYLQEGEEINYTEGIKNITTQAGTPQVTLGMLEDISTSFKNFRRILIVGGQQDNSPEYHQPLQKLINRKIPVVGDIISNLHPVDEVIKHADVFLGQDKGGLHESMQPDLLITFGKSTISKNLKLLLRKLKPQEHWHIQPNGYVADTYQSLTKVIKAEPASFLNKLANIDFEPAFDNQKQENFYYIWQIEERKSARLLDSFFPNTTWGEFESIKEAITALPSGSALHLANSMAVRYANFIGISDPSIEVFANRGTSGIDGSNSTAVGHAMANPNQLNTLITGDLAFFYDRNAFWHNYPLPNLRIVLLNNHAGGIFRIINGPSKLPELENYFETKQSLNAQSLAKEFDFEYLLCDKKSKLHNYLKDFYEPSTTAKILEIESDSATNAQILKEFKNTYRDIK